MPFENPDPPEKDIVVVHHGVTGGRKTLVGQTPFAPPDFDPRATPIRWCKIWLRPVHVVPNCKEYCGKQYEEECKFADRDPKPSEVMVTLPVAIIEGPVKEVTQWRKEHSPMLHKGGSR
jgi:hypothetical protein